MSDDPALNAYIMNMCAKADTTPAEAPRPPPSQQIPADRRPEDYEWLRQAMQSIESPERKIKRLLETVEKVKFENEAENFILLRAKKKVDANPAGGATSSGEATASSNTTEEVENKDKKVITEDDVLDALEELADMLEDINWASEFLLMNGPQRVLDLLQPLNAPAAKAATEPYFYADNTEALQNLLLIIANSSQLNEKLQAAFHQLRWATVLTPLLLPSLPGASKGPFRTNWSVAAALLHACSCLCRDCYLNTLQFVELSGLQLLVEVLKQLKERFFSVPNGTAAVFTSDSEKKMIAKIVRRIFFFAAYTAEAGISSEELVHLICCLTSRAAAAWSSPLMEGEEEVTEEDKEEDRETATLVEQLGAMALLALYKKSPTFISTIVKEDVEFSQTLRTWRQTVQRESAPATAGSTSDDDRLNLINALEKGS